MAGRSVRIATAQCELGSEVEANIAELVRCVGEAAAEGAQLVVLPAFANHPPVYDSPEQAWSVAIDLDGDQDDFVRALVAAAAHHDTWVVANATARREPATVDDPARITVTQLLFSPTDGLVAQSDEQFRGGAQQAFTSVAESPGEVIDTPLGRIGLYCGTDGLIPEPARHLAVGGAEILCTSVDSSAGGTTSSHVPARAAENGVWVVASGSSAGAGASQVAAPDGTVVGTAPGTGEALVVVDVDLDAARRRRRADGTPLLGLRRPDVYFPIAQAVAPLPPTAAGSIDSAALQLGATALQFGVSPGGSPADPSQVVAVDRIVADVGDLAAGGCRLIVLPELAAHPGGLVADPVHAAMLDAAMLDELGAVLEGTDCLVVASVVSDMDGRAETGFAHLGVVVSAAGVLLGQPALHAPERHRSWQVDLGDRVKVLATAFGRLSVLPGDDAIVPESARLAVIGGAEVLGLPFSVTEASDLSVVMPQRCAENQVCVLLGSRPGPFGGAASFEPTGTTVRSRGVADGADEDPDRDRAASGDHLRVVLHPERSKRTLIGSDTDPVGGRRPELRAALVTPRL